MFERCTFTTSRLTVREWHAPAGDDWPETDLASVVSAVMTEPVTSALPPEWQGPFTIDRAIEWITARDSEGPTLLVVDRSNRQAVGLVILFESVAEDGTGVDVRLGFILAEASWGRGLASELIEGFVRWCRTQSGVRSLAGGLEPGNAASRRVLEKNGFEPVEDSDDAPDAIQFFELRL